jgi:diguanylate cyclase (GGDEF)-like protein
MQVMFSRKIKRARTSGSAMCLAVLDLDRFKQFNDEYGHQLGDTLLQQVAGGLRDLFRTTDLIARFGGDEFAVLLPETTLDTAKLVGERVRLGILKRVANIAPMPQPVTISVGLTELYANDDLESLLLRADQALYRAKSQGRNRVRG